VKAGFHVLRFDYYGSGDSAGSRLDGDVSQWKSDIYATINEIKTRGNIDRVGMVGFRVGATMSMLAALEIGNIYSIVLIDPIFDGDAYVEELKMLHKDMLHYAHVKEKYSEQDQDITELLGFPYSSNMINDFINLKPPTDEKMPAERMLIIESHIKYKQRNLKNYLEITGADVSYLQMHEPSLWVWVEDFTRTIVPNDLIKNVIEWLSEGSS